MLTLESLMTDGVNRMQSGIESLVGTFDKAANRVVGKGKEIADAMPSMDEPGLDG